MKNNRRSFHQKIAFGFLIILLASGLFLFMQFAGYPQYQFRAVLVFSFLYFVWGIAFHLIKGDFHLKIMIEYLLVSLVAILLLRGAIFR